MYVKRNSVARSRNRCWRGKVKSLCVRARACMWVPALVGVYMRDLRVVLLIQYAMRMRRIVTSFVAPQSPPHFSTLSHKR